MDVNKSKRIKAKGCKRSRCDVECVSIPIFQPLKPDENFEERLLKKEFINHPLHLAAKARHQWLKATTEEEIESSLVMYHKWWKYIRNEVPKDKEALAALACEEASCSFEFHQEKAILIMCQQGTIKTTSVTRDEEANKMMREIGMVARLSNEVLRYTSSLCPSNKHGDEQSSQISSESFPGHISDNLIPKFIFEILFDTFGSINAHYWKYHQYSVEPPSPFVSYLIPLCENNVNEYGAIGYLANCVYETAVREQHRFQEIVEESGFFNITKNDSKRRGKTNFQSAAKSVKGAKYAEIWVHNRNHPTGHQMHFDSDNEGREGIRNPTIGSIFYLSGDSCGGPTLLTGQRLGDTQLTDDGWLVWPKENRLLLFDGTRLHGVVPGRGISEGRRVTVMCALWHDIELRRSSTPGAARPFPTKTSVAGTGQKLPEWAEKATTAIPPNFRIDEEHKTNKSNTKQSPSKGASQRLRCLWETTAVGKTGQAWPKGAPIPPYSSVFQGF
eukprot:Tbor_TRINITY_DN6188_c1_g1::TRINITY_DN6188_c1_g1_i1::g.22240::m.22240